MRRTVRGAGMRQNRRLGWRFTARGIARGAVALGLVAAIPVEAAAVDAHAAAREGMLREVAAMARETSRETGRPVFADAVMGSMRRVPRHAFVPAALVAVAYENRPLPIGLGQTISQPYIVALSTDLLDLRPEHRVLEIGTGSGYQAAVLAEIAASVATIEIVEPLGRAAAARLAALGYRNVEVRIGDGYRGWPERAPFDRILVTAAAPEVPAPLVEQLARGGRMVIPVGPSQFAQQLLLVEKRADGSVNSTVVLPVRFVPLTGPGVESDPRRQR